MINTKILLISLVFISCLWAQEIRIQGKVTDKETGRPLAGVNISINELKTGAVSDRDGNYALQVNKEGRFVLVASYVGFSPSQVSVLLNSARSPLRVNFRLMPEILEGQSILITSTRAKERETPVTFSNITSQELRRNYTAGGVPLMLNTLPNVYSYSLSGDELGYSFLKIRGFDQKRIGVMINDIPLNDPEDQQVYWVDMPDFGENVQDIQVQRGVGSSNYGAHTFGGSVNINTSNFSGERSISAQYGLGSYGTHKFSAQYKSGLIDGRYAFYSRFSKIDSKGFRDNSASDLSAFYLSAARFDEKMVSKINIYGGQEITHPDWYGIPRDILKTNRSYNSSSYKNDIDNFNQPHYEFINEWKLSQRLQWKNTLYYIHGSGYYENFKTGKKLGDFGMNAFRTTDPGLFGGDSLSYYQTNSADSALSNDSGYYTVLRTDLVRRKQVIKNHYGAISQIILKTRDSEYTFGLSGYLFDSRHFGRVLWAKNLPDVYSPDREYYRYTGNKKALSFFYNNLYHYSDKIKLFTNLLYEHKTYEFEQKATALFQGALLNAYTVEYNFVSPRLGVNYLINDQINLYSNFSFAQREPTDDELYDVWQGPDDLGAAPLFAKSDTLVRDGRIQSVHWSRPYVKPEQLLDYELGLNYRSSVLALSCNLYWMDFRNEILPYGGLDKDGNPIKGNAKRTVHRGAELSVNGKINSVFSLSANAAFSQNYFADFTLNAYDWDIGQVVKDDLSGKAIAGFPGLIANLKLDMNRQGFYGALSARHVGKQYLDNTENEQRLIKAHTTLNALFRYRLPPLFNLPRFDFVVRFINLLDAKYETAGYFDAWEGKSYYWPAAGRHFYAALRVAL